MHPQGALADATTVQQVSIHLREWGAMHPTLDDNGLAPRVSIHLREWGAMHPRAKRPWGDRCMGFNSPS